MSEIKSDTEPKAFDAKKILEKLTPEQKDVLQKLFIGYPNEISTLLEVVLEQIELAEAERNQILEALNSVIKESKIERERISLDMAMKELSIHFKGAFVHLLEKYQINPEQIECLVGRELIAIKRIADVIFAVEDKEGNKYLLSVEFEARYKSDEKMDQRVAEYQHLSSMDREFKNRRIKCNVFYLQSSPQSKFPIEKRKSTYSPENNPDLKIEIVYQVFHINKFDIPMILEQDLPFLIPLIPIMPKATDEEKGKYKKQLATMLENMDEEQRRSAENLIDYISKNQHNGSGGITISEMLEGADLNIWDNGKAEGLAEGLAKGLEKNRETMQKLFIQGAITYKVLKEILGEEEANAIKNIRDKTEGALEEEKEN